MAAAHNPNYVGNVPPIWLGGGGGGAIAPGTIIGQVLYWDGLAWVALDPGNAGQQLTTQGAGAAPIWAAGEAVLGESFTPDEARLSTVIAIPPAETSQRNERLLIDFADGTGVNENCSWPDVMGDAYAGGSLRVDVDWIAATAVAGDVRWGVQWERLNAGGPDLDASTFAAALFGTSTTNATSGVITRTSITFTQAQADGITAEDPLRLLLFRDAVNVGDTMVGDAQLVRVAVREV